MTDYEIHVYMDKRDHRPDKVFMIACQNDDEAFAFAETARRGYRAKFATTEICWRNCKINRLQTKAGSHSSIRQRTQTERSKSK